MICEKPFTPTFKEADDLVTIAKKQNKLLAVYQSMSKMHHFTFAIYSLHMLFMDKFLTLFATNQIVAGMPTSSPCPNW